MFPGVFGAVLRYFSNLFFPNYQDLDDHRLTDLYFSSATGRTRIRNMPELTKRIVGHVLNIHSKQMSDDFAKEALENIYSAQLNYDSAVGFLPLPHTFVQEDYCYNLKYEKRPYVFVNNMPFILYFRGFNVGIVAYSVLFDEDISVRLIGVPEEFIPKFVYSVFKNSHCIVVSTSSEIVLISLSLTHYKDELIGRVVLVVSTEKHNSTITVGRRHDSNRCFLQMSLINDDRFSSLHNERRNIVGTLSMSDEYDVCDAQTPDPTGRSEVRNQVVSAENKCITYRFRYHQVDQTFEYSGMEYELVRFVGFDLETDIFYLTTFCGHVLELRMDTLDPVRITKLNYNIGSCYTQESSFLLDVLIETVIKDITRDSTEIIRYKDVMYLMMPLSHYNSTVFKVHSSTGEVLNSYPGCSRWHSDTVTIEASASIYKEPSVYITIGNMKMHILVENAKFFVKCGKEDLPVNTEGLILHRDKPLLSLHLCEDSWLASHAKFAYNYDGKSILIGGYHGYNGCMVDNVHMAVIY